MELPEEVAQQKAQDVLDGVLQRVSRILNERAAQGEEVTGLPLHCILVSIDITKKPYNAPQ